MLNSEKNVSTNATISNNNSSFSKLNERAPSGDSLEDMLNIKDYSSHSMHESHLHHRSESEFKSEQQKRQHLITKSNTEEIISHSQVKEESYHHSSSIENQIFSIISSPKPHYYITTNDDDENQFKTDYQIRPSIENFDKNQSIRSNSLRNIDEIYSTNFSTHSHLREITKEIRNKESFENQKYLKAKELEKLQRKEPSIEYPLSNSHLKEIFSEIQAHNNSKKKSSTTSMSSTRSSSSDKVFIDAKDRHQLNQVVGELMTADLNSSKYADQSPYLNGIMGEALAQNGMKTSMSAYSTYLSSNKSLHSNSSFDENTSSYTNDQQKKRITNGVAVLPINFQDSLYKKPSNTNKSSSIELVDYDDYYGDNISNKNTTHLVDIMREIILSNNEFVAKSVANKRVENVLPATYKTNQQSSSSSTSKIVRQVAFEEVTTSSTKKVIEENSASKNSYHQTTSDLNNTINSSKNNNNNNKSPTISPQPPRRIEYHVPTSIENFDKNQSIRSNSLRNIDEIYSTNFSTHSHLREITKEIRNKESFENQKYLKAKELEKLQRKEPSITIFDRDEIKNALPIGEDRGFGLVRLTVHYDELRTRFSVTIHEARFEAILT